MEITEEGSVRLVEGLGAATSGPGPGSTPDSATGSVGLFGEEPDGTVQTQTNRGSRSDRIDEDDAAEILGLNAAIPWLSRADVGTVGDILDVERLLTLAVAGAVSHAADLAAGIAIVCAGIRVIGQLAGVSAGAVGHLPDVPLAVNVDGRLAAVRRLAGLLGRFLAVAAVFRLALAVAGPVGDALGTIVLLISGVRVAGGVRVAA